MDGPLCRREDGGTDPTLPRHRLGTSTLQLCCFSKGCTFCSPCDKQIPASNTKQFFSLRSLQRSTEKCECSKFLSSSKSKKSPKPAFFFKKKIYHGKSQTSSHPKYQVSPIVWQNHTCDF